MEVGYFFFSYIFSLFSLSLGDGSTQTRWLVVLGLMALLDCISVYIGPSPRERAKEKRSDR